MRSQAATFRQIGKTCDIGSVRWLAALTAIGCGVIGTVLLAYYAFVPPLAIGLLVFSFLFFASPNVWLLAIPALLPVIGFAPWTGWLIFEELDLLVLSAAMAGYMRVALGKRAPPSDSSVAFRYAAGYPSAKSTSALLLITMFSASALLAMLRGFDDAGGFRFGWFQGYHEPMNSLRLAKSFFEALLLLPLWLTADRRDPARSSRLFSVGLILGLSAASMATVWERIAFTGLLDFSSDYRTTALFWEMHVGGAALDGFLALTVPFALRELLASRSPLRWSLSALVCTLAGYACLTSFSRGVYVAVPAGLAVFLYLRASQTAHSDGARTAIPGGARTGPAWATRLLLIAGFGVGAAWMFPTSGYRGAGALLGTMALLLSVPGVLRSMPLSHWLAGGVGGLLLAAVATTIAWVVPKGAYMAYAVALGLTALARWAPLGSSVYASVTGPVMLAGYMATATSVVLVAGHWGYAVALVPAASVSTGCLLVLMAAGLVRQPLWPDDLRWQAGAVYMMGLVLAVIGVFGGGAFMGDRFSSGSLDLDNRFTHWKLGTDMLQSPADWWLGKGQGRFPSNYFLLGDPKDRPGDYRVHQDGANSFLRLTSGMHMAGDNELFRATQRVSLPARPTRLAAQIRAPADARLRFEVCEKHLLYKQNCMQRHVEVKAAPGKWQSVDVELQGDALSRGRWYAPRLIAFSMSVDMRGGMVEVTKLYLSGPDKVNLLSNGDFSDGMRHWFSSSDKNHMPWHMKNVFLHVLFDQGIVGLVLWSLLVVGALVRLGSGRAKLHPIAPALAAGIWGFLVVGLFDSLLDVPRVAFLFYFFVLTGLTLTGGGQQRSSAAREVLRIDAGHVPRKTAPTRWGWPARALMSVWCIAMLALAAVGLLAYYANLSPVQLADKTPAEAIRHLKPWLAEHPLLGKPLLPPLETLQSSLERPPPSGQLPTLGKGQQVQPLPAQRYTAQGIPLAAGDTPPFSAVAATRLGVGSPDELRHAVRNATPGQVVEVRPGTYRITAAVVTGNPGTSTQPISVRAAKPGDVVVEFDTVEGFRVTQPYWIFENLTIRGVCERDNDCEHAFHVVGAARGIVLRNNRLEGFNAHIKVNGEGGKWPDQGLAQFNTLTNQRPRHTGRPVTPFDLVAASDWQVTDNLISNFAKVQGNQISYGVFMKGAGTGGRIERNLVVCSTSNISQAGSRIGISWGAGGTDAGACRDKACAFDFTGGIAANNVVAHCNDAGIDTNRSRHILLAHNTLINTAGILIRGKSENIHVEANLLEGRIRSDPGITLKKPPNDVGRLDKVLEDPDSLQLDRKTPPPSSMQSMKQVPRDFCNRTRGDSTLAGATVPGRPPCVAPQP